MKRWLYGLIIVTFFIGCSESTNPDAPALEPEAIVGTYQAESASLGGGAKVESNNIGYTGSGFVNFASTGSYAQWNSVSVSTAGSYTLQFRYALGSSSSRTVALKVNGSTVSGGLTFQPTGSWSTWRTVSKTVSLRAGTNTIRLEATGQDAGNVDRLDISTASAVTVVAAGDISCGPNSPGFNGGAGTSTYCHMKQTAEVVKSINPAAVFALGDIQYDLSTYENYLNIYDKTWGAFRSKTRPIPGNHEYDVSGASGYYKYFGSAAGDLSKGYYSFNIGDWHVVALNSVCEEAGGCQAGSPQEKWLRADLAANSRKCTLALIHDPRYSSGRHGNTTAVRDFWKALYDYNADLVLSGNDHHYERFAPQDYAGRKDTSRGLRQFIVGTGGKSLYSIYSVKTNSEVRHSGTYGVLRLTLRATGYDWKFVPEAGKTFTDSGSTSCH